MPSKPTEPGLLSDEAWLERSIEVLEQLLDALEVGKGSLLAVQPNRKARLKVMNAAAFIEAGGPHVIQEWRRRLAEIRDAAR